jgi:hypothetical protein
VIKKLIQAAALLAACSGAAHASTYEFTYAFADGVDSITGTLDATLSGNVLTNITGVSVSFDGTAFSGPLHIGSWDATTGAPNYAPGAAVISTDGSLNNFFISDTTDPANNGATNWFYFVNGTTPDQYGSHEVFGAMTSGLGAYDNDQNGGLGTWSLQPVPVPAALPLMLSGLGFFAAARRRRQGAAA